MRFEAFVAARYLRGKRKNHFVSLITVISTAGVCVGVMALIVVISVMTGFQEALHATIIGNRAHLSIFEPGARPIENPDAMAEDVLEASDTVVAAGPKIEIEALLTHDETATGAYIVGVDPDRESEITMLAQNLTTEGGRTAGRGALPEDKEIVLGFRLANRLGVGVGSRIGVVTNKRVLTPFGPRMGNQLFLRVSGISQAKMSEFDTLYAFTNIATAQMLTGNDTVDAIHVRLTDPFLAAQVKQEIQNKLGYRALTWFESQEAFFEALRQEKLAMFIILTFIILVAAFNITSTLIMVVMEKRRDIGILRTLGASTPSILGLFILEGLMIGLGGTFFGLIFGILLAQNINPVAEFLAGLFGVDLFNSQIYYFDGIPVSILPGDIITITIAAVILSFLSTLYPAWSAARLNPVDALRHE